MLKKRLNLIHSNVIIWFILILYLNPTSNSLLSSPLKPQDYTSPKNLHTHIRHLLHAYGIKYRMKIYFFCIYVVIIILYFCNWTCWKRTYFSSISMDSTYIIPCIHLSWQVPWVIKADKLVYVRAPNLNLFSCKTTK